MCFLMKESNTAKGIAKGIEQKSNNLAIGSGFQFTIQRIKKHARQKHKCAISKFQNLGNYRSEGLGYSTEKLERKNWRENL